MRYLLISALLLLPLRLAGQATTNCDEGAGPLDSAQPKNVTVQQILDKVAANESALQQALTHYTYTQDIKVQTVSGDTVDGEFRRVTNISWDHGQRREYVTFAPQSTLLSISMSKEDFDDINRTPFILSKEEGGQYNVLYDGHQRVDELGTYVFEVAPKQLEKGKRYFQGKVWVEDQGFNVVKSCGKSVPDTIPQPDQKKKKKKKQQEENVSPTMVTYREQIDGNWFPTYERADQTLQFINGDVHIREIIKYSDFKRADSTSTAQSSSSQH